MPKARAFERAPLPFEVIASLQALGDRVRAARKGRKLSVRDLADMLGISPVTMGSIERGAPTVQIGHYARALWLLEVADTRINSLAPSVFEADEGMENRT